MMKYAWDSGTRISLDPQEAGEALADLRKRLRRKIDAKDLLKVATTKTNMFHYLFEWDDSVAAYEYRLTTARWILRKIVIVMKNDSVPYRRAFIAIKVNGGSEYETRKEVLSKKEYRAQLVGRAKQELQSWVDRYSDIPELKTLCRKVEALL